MLSYVFKTGFKNLGNKKLFTFASIGTIASSVLIFCIFFAIATNIKGLINKVETTIGIQVFFNQGLSEEEIQNIVMCDGIAGIISKDKIYIITL